MLLGLCSCANHGTDTSQSAVIQIADTITHHAEYLDIYDSVDGTTFIDIKDPWNDGNFLGRYALVNKDSTIPNNISDNYVIIRTPVERIAAYSAIHTQALDELGAIGNLVAVADAIYFPSTDTISALLRSGEIVDVGSSQAPSVEKLAMQRVDLVLRSPMQGIIAPKLPSTIVPIECADYLETTPIGRAEWILLLGEICDKRDVASQIFKNVEARYLSLCERAKASSLSNPKVITEYEQSGIWYVPAGESYMARLLIDAGAEYPWENTSGSGSLPLSFEKVAEKAIDADIWLLRTFGYTPDTHSLMAQNAKYRMFKAVKNNAVYGCDTSVKPLFNDLAFHPELILADYVAIFHPDVMPGYELRYFSKSK